MKCLQITPVLLLVIAVLMARPSVAPIALADDRKVNAMPDEVKQFFARQDKTVITFMGYSGAGYEDADKMIEEARNVLSVHSPQKTIVNIGATDSGIGAVYVVAKKMGFQTTGIVSTQARKYAAQISPHVDKTFYVSDETWGGFIENTTTLSPTSEAMVQCSDVIISIGGGAVSRDEMTVAKRLGKTVKYIPADLNHKAAIAKARKNGLPIPTDFRGEAFEVGKAINSE